MLYYNSHGRAVKARDCKSLQSRVRIPLRVLTPTIVIMYLPIISYAEAPHLIGLSKYEKKLIRQTSQFADALSKFSLTITQGKWDRMNTTSGHAVDVRVGDTIFTRYFTRGKSLVATNLHNRFTPEGFVSSLGYGPLLYMLHNSEELYQISGYERNPVVSNMARFIGIVRENCYLYIEQNFEPHYEPEFYDFWDWVEDLKRKARQEKNDA